MFGKGFNALRQLSRSFSFGMSEGKLMLKRQKQAKLAQKIKEALTPTFVKVDDITIGSNSCGQMYNITVESELFIGKSLVQQHKMVTDSIAEDLKSIHGYNLKTKAPKKVEPEANTQKKQQTKVEEKKE